MSQYRRLEVSHRLSEYEVLIPEWVEGDKIVRPFSAWHSTGSLPWYQGYNSYKHDRATNASAANFGALIEAWTGLFALLTSQFYKEDFSVDEQIVGWSHESQPNEFQHGIGGYLKFRAPGSWNEEEKYDFPLADLFRGKIVFENISV